MLERNIRYKLPGQGSINALVWSSDGTMLATACSSENSIRLWDVRTRQALAIFRDDTSLFCPTWTPDGKTLITTDYKGKIKYWDVETGEQRLQAFSGSDQLAVCLACAPTSEIVASGERDGMIRLWDVKTGQHLRTLSDHQKLVSCLSWSADGTLASGSFDETIILWRKNEQTGAWQASDPLRGHFGAITSLIWLQKQNRLISGSEDKTIRVWNIETGQEEYRLEGHTAAITSLSPTYDGSMFASKADDIHIWSTYTWKTIYTLPAPAQKLWVMTPEELASNLVAFHPHRLDLALSDKQNTDVIVYQADVLREIRDTDSYTYTNARVVLVGDTAVGKTALGHALIGQEFEPTESTHNRTIWSFHREKVLNEDGTSGQREIFLWDLAGQTSYRVIHQLHLNDVAVALVLFDARSETDPFAGVWYWRRALRQAGNAQTDAKKLLVSARVDRGGPMVSRERINAFMHSSGFDDYYETSAKYERGISELAEAIKQTIDWIQLPKATMPNLFRHIQAFLLTEKESKHLLSPAQDLYRTFLAYNPDLKQSNELFTQFQVCVELLEAQGLIRRFTFGDLVLLQPELIDAYASALILAVRKEPDGLGTILEERVRRCEFSIPHEVRTLNEKYERLLMLAMIEDLIDRDVALRESSNKGVYLVFPAQTTLEHPEMPDPGGKAIVFSFEGPVLNIYVTLAVRLSYTGFFNIVGQWKNAIVYNAIHTNTPSGKYGILLDNREDGRAKLTLFFDAATTEEMRYNFEQYIKSHLDSRATPNSLHRRRIFYCSNPDCGPLTEDQAKRRRERGFDWAPCPVCGEPINLHDEEERFPTPPPSRMPEMTSQADQNHDRSVAVAKLDGKIETRDFDVFLCYNRADREEVEQLRKQLHERGILPWYDMDVQPGLPWQKAVIQQIQHIKSAAVFVGKGGIGPWQTMQIDTLMNEFTKRERRIIPVILKQALHVPEIPPLLETFSRVDFREGEQPNPLGRLIWGITGKRPENIFEAE